MAAPATFPGFWMDETSGVLRPVIEAYLRCKPLEADEIAAMRAYLRQWINAPVWAGPNIRSLRDAIDELTSRTAIAEWLEAAQAEGIDPL